LIERGKMKCAVAQDQGKKNGTAREEIHYGVEASHTAFNGVKLY